VLATSHRTFRAKPCCCIAPGPNCKSWRLTKQRRGRSETKMLPSDRLCTGPTACIAAVRMSSCNCCNCCDVLEPWTVAVSHKPSLAASPLKWWPPPTVHSGPT
jgi:hypothetical protein